MFITPYAIGGFNYQIGWEPRKANEALLVQGGRRHDHLNGISLVLEALINKRDEIDTCVVYVGTTPSAVRPFLLALKLAKFDPKKIVLLVCPQTPGSIGAYLLGEFPEARHITCEEPGSETMGHLVDYFLDHGTLLNS